MTGGKAHVECRKEPFRPEGVCKVGQKIARCPTRLARVGRWGKDLKVLKRPPRSIWEGDGTLGPQEEVGGKNTFLWGKEGKP